VRSVSEIYTRAQTSATPGCFSYNRMSISEWLQLLLRSAGSYCHSIGVFCIFVNSDNKGTIGPALVHSLPMNNKKILANFNSQLAILLLAIGTSHLLAAVFKYT